MKEHLRETLEYDEARGLLLKKAALRAELARLNSVTKGREPRGFVLKKAALRAEIRKINSEIKQLHHLSPDAVIVAQTDIEQSARDDG